MDRKGHLRPPPTSPPPRASVRAPDAHSVRSSQPTRDPANPAVPAVTQRAGHGPAPLVRSSICARAPGNGEQWAALLQAEAIAARAVYRLGEVCRLPQISPTTLRQFRALAEHPDVSPRDSHALDFFLVGCHHRIAHAALVERLAWKQTFSGRGEGVKWRVG